MLGIIQELGFLMAAVCSYVIISAIFYFWSHGLFSWRCAVSTFEHEWKHQSLPAGGKLLLVALLVQGQCGFVLSLAGAVGFLLSRASCPIALSKLSWHIVPPVRWSHLTSFSATCFSWFPFCVPVFIVLGPSLLLSWYHHCLPLLLLYQPKPPCLLDLPHGVIMVAVAALSTSVRLPLLPEHS